MTRFHRGLVLLCTVAAWLLTAASAAAQATRGTITGTVTDATGKLTGISIILTTPAGIDRPAASDVNGAYTFGGLQPGEYRLRVEDASGKYAPWSQDKIVVAAGDRKVIDIALQPRVQAGLRASISGTVIGPNGRPLSGATLVLSGVGADQRASSGATGAYTFANLGPGTYRVRVAQTDALPFQSDPIVVAAGAQQSVDVHLQPLPPPPPPPTPANPNPPANPTTPPTTPSRGTGPASAQPPAPPPPAPGLEAQPDRWAFRYPTFTRYPEPAQTIYVKSNGPFDPYNQNTLKGDFPVSGSTFLNLNLQFNSTLDPGKTADGAVTGPASKLVYNQNAVLGAELFGGDSVFEPKRWAVRVTDVVNVNAAKAGSFTFGPAKVKNSFEELFGEVRVAVTSPNFDFMSVRGGMQNFNSDFRGFLYVDNQMGVRLFGNSGSNSKQFNGAFFSMRPRDPVSQLHTLTKSVGQNVFIGNIFLQDLVARGYTLMVNAHVNQDKRTVHGVDATPQAGDLMVVYAGVHGDGHFGAWSVSHAFYQAFGHDNQNVLATDLGRPATLSVNAQLAAIELSHDSDATRTRFSFLYASGDSGSGAKASGFDAITDNPNFAGGQFMFWDQQAIKIPGLPGGFLKQKFSLLPSMRDKFTDRSNFLNPGLMLINGGYDLRMSPKLKIVVNGSYLRLANVSIVQQALKDASKFPDGTIGLDMGVGFKFRPALNENLFIVGGVSALLPMGGLKTALAGAGAMFSAFATFQIAY